MSKELPLEYTSAAPLHTFAYILNPVIDLASPIDSSTRILDIGCGNAAIAGELRKRFKCKVVGLDLSVDGIEIARKTYPDCRFEVLAADENVLANLQEDPFDRVISTEVVEHLYDPKSYIRGCFSALRSGGRLIVSTPYHGYLKNLSISLANGWDSHINPLWDGGHIKFWSRRSLTQLMSEGGFTDFRFRGAGRLPYLWKSMVMSAVRP